MMRTLPLGGTFIHKFAQTIRDAAGVGNGTVYKWIDKFDMPAHRLGRLWKFKKAEVDKWVKSGGAAEEKKKHTRDKS